MSIRSRFIRTVLAACTLVFASSCYYDGYYSSYGAYDSYGYSGGGVSFVYTSSDRWLYDPVVYCYYDRHRRAYYDPYLYGYYPVGYVPRPIYGVPHPHGWRPGRGYCPPPSNFRDRRLSNYHNRTDLLRSRQYSWAGSVRERNDGNMAAWQSRRLQNAAQFPSRQQAAERPRGNRPAPQGSPRENSWGSRSGGDATRPGFGTPRNPSARPPETRDWNRSQRGNWQENNRQPSRDDRGRVAPRPSFNQPVDTGTARQRQAEGHRARSPEGRQHSFEPRPAPAPRQETRPAPPPPPREEARPSSRGGGSGGWQNRGGGDGERERGRRGR